MKIAIIGGGIVGLSIGYKLQLIKGNKVTLFEKEQEVGLHQSGRNSGVLHCGLAYKPGSLKAKLAVNGIKQMISFCKMNPKKWKFWISNRINKMINKFFSRFSKFIIFTSKWNDF